MPLPHAHHRAAAVTAAASGPLAALAALATLLTFAAAAPAARATDAPAAEPPPDDAAQTQHVPPQYRTALRAAGVAAANAALVIRPLDGGTVHVEERAGAAMSPASTMKLVTTWAALNRLGPAFRWRTEALVSGTLRQGRLDGSLALRGGGDPALVIENLWLLVHRIRGYGIRELHGDVLLDRSAFAPVAFDPEAFDGDGLRAYNAGPDALLVNFKAITLDFVPDPLSGTARIVVTPPLAGARVPLAVRGSEGACGDWHSHLQADFSAPLAPTFRGSYPLACGLRSWNLNLLDPTPYFEAVFRALWEGSGGSWSGRAIEATVPADARLVATLESKPLPEVIRDINKFSNNVMARQVLLTLARLESDQPATAAAGAANLRAFLAEQGLEMPELVLENGSGLSRNERIAPASLAALLAQAWRSPLAPEFIASLPLAGIDGTARRRAVAAGYAHIKTGMLDGVRAIAGIVQARSGRHYVIVAIINDEHAAAAQAAHDALLEWLHAEG